MGMMVQGARTTAHSAGRRGPYAGDNDAHLAVCLCAFLPASQSGPYNVMRRLLSDLHS